MGMARLVMLLYPSAARSLRYEATSQAALPVLGCAPVMTCSCSMEELLMTVHGTVLITVATAYCRSCLSICERLVMPEDDSQRLGFAGC